MAEIARPQDAIPIYEPLFFRVPVGSLGAHPSVALNVAYQAHGRAEVAAWAGGQAAEDKSRRV
jgi:hypothetical protein